jgi:hypothetical protein
MRIESTLYRRDSMNKEYTTELPRSVTETEEARRDREYRESMNSIRYGAAAAAASIAARRREIERRHEAKPFGTMGVLYGTTRPRA